MGMTSETTMRAGCRTNLKMLRPTSCSTSTNTIRQRHVDACAADSRSKFVGTSLGDYRADVENDHSVGESINLFKVLRRQQHRRTPGPQIFDDLPQRLAASWVESRGWFIEENNQGSTDQAHREVEAPAHSTGVRPQLTVRGIEKIKLGEELNGAGAS